MALLDSLELRGFVERRRDPEDRRRHVVSITPVGKRELSRIRAAIKRLEDSYLAPLDEAKREQLHALLGEIAAQNDPSCCPFDDAA